MTIHSFLKVDHHDPDWQFTPEEYIGKQFKIIEGSLVELRDSVKEQVVLRQNPSERELIAKKIKIVVGENAELDLIILNEMDKDLQQVFLYEILLKAGAKLNFGLFLKDGKLNKHIVEMYLEDGSAVAAYGITSNESGGSSEVNTKVMHNKPASTSQQLFYGVAGEASQSVFQSITLTDPDAIYSNVAIDNVNLITGEGGRCFSKPETFLDAEHVSSSYCSETTSIDVDTISYLQSKGIDEVDADKLIVDGFRSRIIDIIPSNSIKAEATEMYLN